MPAEIKGLNEECGVFGVFGAPDASQLTYYGLHPSDEGNERLAELLAKSLKSLL